MRFDHRGAMEVLGAFRDDKLEKRFATENDPPDARPCAIELSARGPGVPLLRIVYRSIPEQLPGWAAGPFTSPAGTTVQVSVVQGDVPRALGRRPWWRYLLPSPPVWFVYLTHEGRRSLVCPGAAGSGTVRLVNRWDRAVPYPMDIAPSVSHKETYTCFGNGHRRRREGTLDSLRFGPVELEAGWADFDGVLKFTNMTTYGDSGAVILRKSDSHAVALAFARSRTFTFANPLYELPWELDRERPVIDGFPHFVQLGPIR